MKTTRETHFFTHISSFAQKGENNSWEAAKLYVIYVIISSSTYNINISI